MIKVTKLNKEEVYVNPDLIEFVEANPDTALILRGGRRVVVREDMAAVVKEIQKYQKFVHSNVTARQSGE